MLSRVVGVDEEDFVEETVVPVEIGTRNPCLFVRRCGSNYEWPKLEVIWFRQLSNTSFDESTKKNRLFLGLILM